MYVKPEYNPAKQESITQIYIFSRHEVREFYPNKFIKLTDDRIYVLNTLFNLPGMLSGV